jgi:DNA-binding response OmpR family regulator
MAYILLIEKKWVTQALIKAQLEEAGDETLAVQGLEEVMILLRVEWRKPDLVIFDTFGQGCDDQALDDLCEAAKGIPIILCTGPYDRARLTLETREFAALLIRPFTIGELAERVQEVLRGVA